MHVPDFIYLNCCDLGDAVCTSYFIEPVQWMEQAMLGVMDGQVTQSVFSENNCTVRKFLDRTDSSEVCYFISIIKWYSLVCTSFSCCVLSVGQSWALSAGMVIIVPVVVGLRLLSSCIATEWMRSDN